MFQAIRSSDGSSENLLTTNCLAYDDFFFIVNEKYFLTEVSLIFWCKFYPQRHVDSLLEVQKGLSYIMSGRLRKH